MPASSGRQGYSELLVKAWLALEDGFKMEGRQLGATGTAVGEVVFNTGMTGYQEVLTDPSYAGQIVVFTYPLIGNYGINDDDFESDRIQVAGIVVREACGIPSNWRSRRSIGELLAERGIPAIQGVDTRALTKRIRSAGVTMGVITDRAEAAESELASVPAYDDRDWVTTVATPTPYGWGFSGRESFGESREGYRGRLAVLDCGLKYNILRRFAALGIQSQVFPHTASVDEILACQPDGVLLSPGPGDPERLDHVVATATALVGTRPLFGICLGNQILCRSIGGKTYKMKFGHRGANHPVKDLDDGSVTMTSQNHGYAVDPDSIDESVARVTQINVNDGTVEGIALKGADAWSIQYHPEAAPGPWDSRKYFSQFVERMLG